MSMPPKPLILRAEELEKWHKRESLLSDAQQQARVLLNNARHEADALQAVARESANSIRKESYEAGRRDGEIQAAKQLQQTSVNLQKYLENIESEVADMCLSIIHRVMDEFDEVDVLQRCIRQALKDFQDRILITVRVAPDYVSAIQNGIRESSDVMMASLKVEGDAALSPEQCLLVSMDTVVEISPHAQLAVLGTVLRAPQEVRNE